MKRNTFLQKTTCCQLLLATILYLTTYTSGIAQCLPNDVCSNAIPLNVGSTCTQTMATFTDATNTIDNTCDENDVWFSVVVPTTGEILVETYEGSTDDVELDVFSGSCGSLTSINPDGCQDEDNGPEGNNMEATTITGLSPGDILYIMVDDRGDGGDFSICVTDNTPASNDICANAIPLTAGSTCTQTMATFTGATNTIDNTCDENDVWFSVVVPATGEILVETYEGSTDDVELDVFSGSCGSLTSINPNGCQDEDNGPGGNNMEATTITGLTPGDVIFIMVDDRGDGGDFSICVTDNTPTSNDICTNAIPLTVDSTCTQTMATFTGATNTTDNTCNDNDVWFSVVVPASGEILVETYEGVNDDASIDVFSGSCGSLTSINGGCQDDNNSTRDDDMEETTITGLTPGDVIFIMVDDKDERGNFSICVTDNTPPSNDMCSNAMPLTVGSTCTQTMATFTGATETTDNTCDDDDVWFSVVVPASGEFVVETYAGSIDDVELDVFSGSCGSLTSINPNGCQDEDNGPEGNDMEATTITGLTPGDVIFIMVDDIGDRGNFSICVYDPVLTPGPLELDISDACNCEMGIDLDDDLVNDLSQETITISSGASPYYTPMLTTNFFDATGAALSGPALNALIDAADTGTGAAFDIIVYVPADGLSTYSLDLIDGACQTASINGGLCSVPVTTAVCQDITVSVDDTGNASITAAQIDNGSTDNCGGIASMSLDITDFTCDNIGDNTVTLTITNSIGNSDMCTATVTVSNVGCVDASFDCPPTQVSCTGESFGCNPAESGGTYGGTAAPFVMNDILNPTGMPPGNYTLTYTVNGVTSELCEFMVVAPPKTADAGSLGN